MKKTRILYGIFVSMMIFALMICSVYATPSAVELGTAENFVILAKSGISTTGVTSITGNIGASPIGSTGITGFGLIMDSSNQFATSSLVTGKIYAADYTEPTSTTMTTAVSDMELAYTDAAGRAPDVTELGAGNIGGMTLSPGIYKWSTGLIIPTDVTLSGSSTDVWIFQVAQDLEVSSSTQVILSDGAQVKNIFWQVGGKTTLGTTSSMKGIILCQTAIAVNTGATLNGRALAQTAVTLDANSIKISTIATSEPVEVTSSDEGIITYRQKVPTPVSIVEEINEINNKKDSVDNDSSVEKDQPNQGIGLELNQQISERKEEIKFGEYGLPLGQFLNVRELSSDLRELRVNNVSAQTNLKIIAATDSEGKTKLTTKLNNGSEVEIKIMPNTVSERALERLGLKVCSLDNNCTIQLKDVGSGNTEKIQYEMQLERPSRVMGLFQKQMHLSVDVDAETGNTRVHRPWWAIISTESAE
ncbi:MAG: ice-binding family protein [Candidatus Woesearchaeota archaeon]|jgi:hypothetical protein